MLKVLTASFFIALISELGDKTQWLALSLATRSRRPGLILAGICIGAFLNHLLASWLGDWFAARLSKNVLSIAAGTLFIVFGLWALRPQKAEQDPIQLTARNLFSIAALFFFAESGDKTQIAALTLAAKFHAPWLAALGTTLGTITSDLMAILVGGELLKRLPAEIFRFASAGLFLTFGAASLWSALA